MQSARMKLNGIMAVISALLLPDIDARAESPQSTPNVGDEYEISKSYETSQQTSDGSSSGSSSGRDTILERVIGVREAGLELEYDHPKDATTEDKARSWQFPVRIFKPSIGPMQLLNRSELEARVEGWLKAAKWTRAVCGRWIFTWNAFRIECDPQSVIKTIEAFDLRSADLREGAPYRETAACGSGKLARKAGPDGPIFTTEMPVDPEAVHRARAESDVVVGELMNKPVTLDAALGERAKAAVSGTISITFNADSTGNARRRTKVTKLQTKGPDGRSETETVTEILERRRISPRD